MIAEETRGSIVKEAAAAVGREQLMLRFEALGDNCEFGLVQRCAGAEPLGLLRFAGFFIPAERRLARLMDALESGFSGLGRDETVRVEVAGPNREFLVREDAFDLLYHTFQHEGEIDAERLRGLEARKLGFLRRKFLNDLAAGEKILVWKSNIGARAKDIDALADKLRQFGPNTLLWVAEAQADQQPGSVEALRDGLLKGYVERFAPYENATDIAYESWWAMCEQAYQLAKAQSPAGKVRPVDIEPAPDPDVHPDLGGEDYIDVLRRFHAMLQPKSYLEVGSRSGASLSLAHCPSIAIDPAFELGKDFLGQKPFCLLYRMRSDDFFEVYDPRALLGRPIEFAFLDGMHLAEFLLRDFMNTERHCRPNSVIALHDCIPVEAAIARRKEADFAISSASKHPHWWTGDVWKVVVVLKKFRPDLTISAFDASPTGLVVITNLDPHSTILADNRDVIAASFRSLDLGKMGVRNYVASLNMVPTSSLTAFEDFSLHFGR